MTQGDPRLIITPSGVTLQVIDGITLMDRGLENLALISLFTRRGWVGNQLLDVAIGSDFEEAVDQPITRTSLNEIRDAAEKALDSELFGTVTATVTNPSGYIIKVSILIERVGAQIELTREGGAWSYQATEPAYQRIQ